MCLSTTTATGGNSSTAACANSSCANSTASTCSSSLKSPTTDCNGNTKSSSNSSGSSSSIKHRKPVTNATTSATDATHTKDLVDSLDSTEANAVYKEVSRAAEIKHSHSIATADVEYNPQIRWPDLIAQTFLHTGGLYGVYLLFSAKLYTFLWVVGTIWVSGIGITAGVHRLWSHKSYTASLPLRILLVFLFTISGQRDAYTWALDHRIHHKFSETEADPHNAKRGFFFAHVGWLFLTPHPQVVEKRKVIDVSDLENDGVVMFQKKWYLPLFAICSIGIPVLVPWYFWNEPLWMSFWINFNMRFCCTLNIAFFVNSVAHMWGRKPYDKNISPVESPIVSFLAFGEGWHNYHHVFPWDYKTGEFGTYKLNVTTAFIDICAKLGLATGRKRVSPDMVVRRAEKCGDGTRFLSDDFAHADQVWGYGDRDLPKEDADELAVMKD